MRWPWSRSRRRQFSGTPRPIDQMFLEMARATETSITRESALSVPAVTRGRNLICSIATLPLHQVGPDNTVERSALLEQLDPDVPNVVTLAQTLEDLLFEGISWWEITAQDFAGFPVAVRHLDVSTVSVNPPAGRNPSPLPSGIDPREAVVWVDGQPVPASRVIRFDSPNPGVLKTAGRPIRRAILLDKAAGMYADDPRPLDYFSPAQDAEEVDDAEVTKILSQWKAARKQRSTAWVPASMAYNSVDAPSPQQLQLVELQRQAVLDIANEMGIDPEDLGLSTTSRTYANDVDRRRNKLNEVLAPYMRAITHRLSMGDVTKRGHSIRFDTSEYLMPNPGDRWANHQTALGMGATTIGEIREAEGMPPLPDGAAQIRPETIARLAQQLYLATPDGAVLSADEARDVLNLAGAGLVGSMPERPEPDDPDGDEDNDDDGDQGSSMTQPARTTFNSDRLTFVDVPMESFSVDRENRIIEGTALPYGKVSTSAGMRFRFEPGALQWDQDNPGRVKLLRDHDMTHPLGKAIQLRNTQRGVLARFKVARGEEGDRALELADDGVLDGLSVGVDFDHATDTAPDPKTRGVLVVRRADLRETSLTAMPSFDDARVTKVAASRQPGDAMQCTTCGQEHAEGVTCTATDQTPEPAGQAAGLTLSQDQLTALLARPGAFEALSQSLAQQGGSQEPATPPGGLTLSEEQVDALVRSGQFAQLLGLPQPNRTEPDPEPDPDDERRPVDPTRRPVTLSRINEPVPYRFDRAGNFTDSEHVFSADLHEMALAFDHHGDKTDAGKRVMGLMRQTFNTDAADVNEVNPTINRQDMYVDQRDFRYPIWMAINKGAPPNGVQPFRFPKFNSASGLVGDHTEGTEPTAGSFTTTSQTVTPEPLSGKASITREVWDMGGNPAVSTLIFNQMVRGYREGLEEAAATFLNTLTAATDITLTTAAVDDALASDWYAALAGLQFVRGYEFEVFVVEQVLYETFVDATADDGRPLFPMQAPQNANGTAARRFAQLDLAGVIGAPSWALDSTPGDPNNSWLFDPSVVHGWASTPIRLEFPGTDSGPAYSPVAHVDLAIWGYKAFANSDLGGVRQVIYDSAT